MERDKLKKMRKSFGIYPIFSAFNFLQMPMHMVYISMINRLSYNPDLCPGILNEGFFWFPDLSSPDPTGILPIMGGVVSMVNILTTRTITSDSKMRKVKKFIIFMPLIAVPIQMTFPVVSTLVTLAEFRPLICTG